MLGSLIIGAIIGLCYHAFKPQVDSWWETNVHVALKDANVPEKAITYSIHAPIVALGIFWLIGGFWAAAIMVGGYYGAQWGLKQVWTRPPVDSDTTQRNSEEW